MRTVVDLPAKQTQALTAWCKRERVTRAEAVRRAVGILLGERQRERDAAFGSWRHLKTDGRAYVEALRMEWD